MNTQQTYARGVIYTILAGIFLSSAGLLVRNIEAANPWTVLFYRSLAFSVTVMVFVAWQHRGKTLQRYREMRPLDFIVTLALGCGFIFYLQSLFNTSVANTVLLLSTGPFMAAGLAWIVLRETVARTTILAALAAIAGVLIMVSGGISATDWLGVIYALCAVLAFAVMIVTLRKIGTQRDTMAAVSLAGIAAALMCIPFMPTFAISGHDLLMAILLGSVQIGFGFILITLGTRSVPSAQVPLLALGETALSPLWVWVFVAEVPAVSTLLGGGLVLAAVVFQGVVGLRGR